MNLANLFYISGSISLCKGKNGGRERKRKGSRVKGEGGSFSPFYGAPLPLLSFPFPPSQNPPSLNSRKRDLWFVFLYLAASVENLISARYFSMHRTAHERMYSRDLGQIKNMITTAHALAVDEMVPLSRSHLEVLIRLDEEFQTDYSGVRRMANSMSYA